MLQAHSFLWNYLWVAPSILLLALGLVAWKRGLAKQFPAFFAFILLNAVANLANYFADVTPWVTPQGFWRIYWAGLVPVGALKFAVVAEIFALVFGPYASLARLGRTLIRVVGVLLVFSSALAAAYAPKDGRFGIVSGAHLLEQTTNLIAVGLLAFIFLFSAYFQLKPDARLFGIALGLGISACVHLATSALDSNGVLPNDKRIILDFVDMGSYHVCVLIWFYYLLFPHRVVVKPAPPLPENNLAVWNRELERLLQQ